MSKYDVDIKKLALLLMPTSWRKPILAALAYAGVSGLSNINMRWKHFREETDYRLSHNSQVCYLRAVLNDNFDPFERRITITEDAERYDNSSIHRRDTNTMQPAPIRGEGYGLVVNRRGFSGINSYDFWVNLPLELHGEIQENRVKAIVNIYKLASKRYGISYR